MTGLELVYAAVALVGIGLALLLVRRAARKQLSGRPGRPALEEGKKRPAAQAAPPRTSARAPAKAKPSAAEAEPDRPDSEDSEDSDEFEDSADGADDVGADAEGEPASAAEGDEAPDSPVPPSDGAAALRRGLAKTRGGFVARLGRLFQGKQLDENLLEELEEVLLTADIGPRTAGLLFQALKDKLSKSELRDTDAVWAELRRQALALLDVGTPAPDFDAHRPFVLLTIGVNGVGKTTTIGKLAALHARRGRRVLLGAGDTFRAAACEQLEVWGERAGAPVVRGRPNADPSSVIFDAIQRARADEFDIVIADTAGRLHTKVDLMDELQKVRRTCDKALPGSPHETWLVLDATTGQNAIAQAKLFKQAMDISGIVLTKLDGTAKGGVVLGICHELSVPVRFIGVGESIDDLRPFDAAAFVRALFDSPEDELQSETAA